MGEPKKGTEIVTSSPRLANCLEDGNAKYRRHPITKQPWPNWREPRTETEEVRLKEFTMEQFAWDSEKRIFRVRQLHAENMARRVMGLIEAKRVNYRCGIKDHRGLDGCVCSLVEALETILSEPRIEQMLLKYGVHGEFIEYAIRLVQKSGKARYGNLV